MLISDEGGNYLEAVFEFHSVASNRGVPVGKLTMRGGVGWTPSGPVVKLVPVAWVIHPSGYVMAGMTGSLPARSLHPVFDGTIDMPGCGTFHLHR